DSKLQPYFERIYTHSQLLLTLNVSNSPIVPKYNYIALYVAVCSPFRGSNPLAVSEGEEQALC
ncbi:MAG: hypothetical protein ACOVR6_04400, partial [Fimbriimonas sp.]